MGQLGGGSVVGNIPTDTNVSPRVSWYHLLVVYLVFVNPDEDTAGVERVFENLRM